MKLPEYDPNQLLLDDVVEPEKTASEKVPVNVQAWPTTVLTHLAESVPYVLEGTDYKVVLEKFDQEAGAGIGMVMITNHPAPRQTRGASAQGLRTGSPVTRVALPFIIHNFELSPMDLMATDQPGKEFLPLTERRFDEIMFRSTPFVGVNSPSGAHQGTGAVNNVPYGLSLGYGAHGATKSAMAPEHGLQAASKDISLRPASGFRSSDTVIRIRDQGPKSALSAIVNRNPTTGDDLLDAAQSLAPINVLRIIREGEDDYKTIEVSDSGYLPRTQRMSENQVYLTYGHLVPGLMDSMAEKDDLVVTIDHDERTPVILEDFRVNPSLLVNDADVIAATVEGEFKKGRIYCNVISLDGERLPLKVFTDGYCFGAQNGIAGEVIEPSGRPLPGDPQSGEWGAFANVQADGHVEITLPIKVIATGTIGDNQYVYGETLHNQLVSLRKEKGIGKIYSTTGATRADVSHHIGAEYKVPEEYSYIPLGHLVTLVESPEEMERHVTRNLDNAIGNSAGSAPLHSDDGLPYVVVRQYAEGEYGLQGKCLDDILGKEKVDMIGRKDALYYLVLLGLGTEGADAVLTQAELRDRVTVGNLRGVNSLVAKTAQLAAEESDLELVCQMLRRDLAKDAQYLPQNQGVDELLSLNKINPENIGHFLEELPVLQRTEANLARLLFLIRLGFESVPEGPVERALTNLNEVNEALEFLGAYSKRQRARGQRRGVQSMNSKKENK